MNTYSSITDQQPLAATGRKAVVVVINYLVFFVIGLMTAWRAALVCRNVGNILQ